MEKFGSREFTLETYKGGNSCFSVLLFLFESYIKSVNVWTVMEALLGCLGSMATRTMGVASKLSGVKGEQAGVDDSVADFKT